MTGKPNFSVELAMAAGAIIVFFMFLAALAAIGMFRLIDSSTSHPYNQ